MFGDLIKNLFSTSSFKSVDVITAKELIDTKKVFLLDVRSTGEFANGHIKGAKNIPVDQLESRIGELAAQKEKPILINCLSGGRSASACGILAKNGFSDVTNMTGGMGGWLAARYPVV